MANPERMTLAELQEFIAAGKGEWEQTEFKKTTGELQGGMETFRSTIRPKRADANPLLDESYDGSE